ncbi:MAG: hypothetical protein V4489_02285 [Chlamydiota bacterium]
MNTIRSGKRTDPLVEGLVSTALHQSGITTNDAESQAAATMGTAIICGALYLPEHVTKKLPSWAVPAGALAGVFIAAQPKIHNLYKTFTSFKETTPVENPAPIQAQIPNVSIPLFPIKDGVPATITRSNAPQTISSDTSFNALAEIDEAEEEILNTRGAISSTLLFKNLTENPLTGDPERTTPNAPGSSADTKKLALTTIYTTLNEISTYITNMKPILEGKIKLTKTTDKLKAEIGTIVQNIENIIINKANMTYLETEVNRNIDYLQNSLTSLAGDSQMITPALHFDALNLPTTKRIIVNDSLGNRVDAINNLTKLKETYKTALDSLQNLCALKDAMDKLNQTPTCDNLKATVLILEKIDKDMQGIATQDNSLIPLPWLQKVTEGYTKVAIDYLTQSTNTTTRELNSFLNFSRNTKLSEDRLGFIKALKDMINTDKLLPEDVKANFGKLEEAVKTLEKAISVKQSWQGSKNTFLTAVGSLGVAASITVVRLSVDVGLAYWQKA